MEPPVWIRTRLQDRQGHRGGHNVLVGFTTTCAISAYHH